MTTREIVHALDPDRSCRPGGNCPYCSANRTHSTRKKNARANDSLRDDGE